MVFPAENLGFTPAISGFLDEYGKKIEPKPVAVNWGCSNGHVFKLQDATKAINNGQEDMSGMSGLIPMSG
jgi:hypothetical protein